MTWIKICGTTNVSDALTAVDAGADAVGFVFFEGSPRKVNKETARDIVSQLPDHVEKVGVFVNPEQGQVVDTVNEVRLTATQCRLQRPANGPAEGERFYQPIRILVPLSVPLLLQDENRLRGLIADFSRVADEANRPGRPKKTNQLDTFLLDSGTPQEPGGTGKKFDWQRIAPLVQIMNKSVKVVIAGGLTPDNIAEAMRILRPWGVDVASGVEAEPGKKDPGKVRAFIQAVRQSGRAT
jgi:phosphoribosylanthranilate isomerase